MPIYEYKCRECNEIMEVLQKINSEPLRTCTHCSGKVDKLISNSSFTFKGNGWYVTDYKKSDKDNNKTKSSHIKNKINETKTTKNKSATKGKEKNVA